MACDHRSRSCSLASFLGTIVAVLVLLAISVPTVTVAQAADLCSSQRTRDSCEAQSVSAGSQCYWSGLACHLADACGTDCTKPGCQRCATFPDLCYPLTIACPLACDAYPVEAMCNGWVQPSKRTNAAGCNWDRAANKCLAVGLAVNAANGTVTALAPGQTPGSNAGTGATAGPTSGGTPIGLVLGIIAVVAVAGLAAMVVVTKRRRQNRKAASLGARANAGTPGVPLSSGTPPPPPASSGGRRSSSSFAKPSTAYHGTRQVLSPSTQPLSSSSASTPTTSLTAINAAAPASLDPAPKTNAVKSPVTSPGSTPIPRPAAAWPATGMSPMHQRSSPPNTSRDSMYTDLSTTVTEHPMSMDYVVPEKARMTMISIADTDREFGSEVGTPMNEEFDVNSRRRSSYFGGASVPPPNAGVSNGPIGLRMLPSSASVATSEFSAVTDSGSLGPIALPPAPSSRVNSMAGSSALGSNVPTTPVSAVPSRMHMPDTPASPGSPYSLADIDYYSQVGNSGSVVGNSGSSTPSSRSPTANAAASLGQGLLRR